ncbi:ATP-binding protein [Streptomyces sp. URMC 125]|uniref:ATP-binding protein n=1 Tax=Streptomyces sp. URMC 125 TaxID=3423419 RepID=UPI003F1A41AC
MTVRADVSVVADVRRRLKRCLLEWELASLAEDAQLLTSEILTNAIVHTTGCADVAIVVERRTRGLRVRVRDADTAHRPVLRAPGPQAEVHGRGLHLVAVLSSAWGVDDDLPYKTVWFELDLRP